MDQYGFPRANYSKAAIGIGLQFHLNRFIATLSYNQTTKENEHSSFVTEVDYRSTSFNFGYSLLKNQWYSIYPYVGIKGTGLHYLYREKATDTTSFDAYLQESINYKEIGNSRGILIWELGFRINGFILLILGLVICFR